jgi:hypothetical protein
MKTVATILFAPVLLLAGVAFLCLFCVGAIYQGGKL